MSIAALPHVRAIHCDHRSSDEEVYQSLRRLTAPLSASWERLKRAKRIAIKINQDWPPADLVFHEGQRQMHVSDSVSRAVLRLLQEETTAEIFVIDVGVTHVAEGKTREDNTHILPIVKEFNVPFIDGNLDEVVWRAVPGGGVMFERYPLPRALAEADEIVSVQKMKNHLFMGVTLCLKNLFGLVPLQPLGRPRTYYHHLVRMPYMLVDLGKLMNPALNILDGMVTQAGEEWGKGTDPRVCDTLIAGDQVIATDACATRLMGHDPFTDWLTEPFHRDRNALLIAHQHGFGTIAADQINFESEVAAPIGQFFSKQIDPLETIISWRKTTAEQAKFYQEHRQQIVDQYAGQYILLQMGEVRWADPSGSVNVSRRILAGDHPEQGMWMKYVDPEEAEGEHFEVYDEVFERIARL